MKKEKQLQLFTQASKITLIIAIVVIALYLFLTRVAPSGEPKMDPIIARDIQMIQSDVEAGNISPEEAKQRLIETLKKQKEVNEKLDDGSIESILKKMELQDPAAANAFRQKIIQEHGEEALQK